MGNSLHDFLISEYGAERGAAIHEAQQAALREILSHTVGKSPGQMKTLCKTILPRVALYKVLCAEAGGEQATAVVRKYMLDVVGAAQAKRYARLEGVPGFFPAFRRIMAGFVAKSDNWAAEVTANNGREVRYNITKCLWHDACAENGCPELCAVFCDTDEVIYGKMKKVNFSRQNTLAKGGAHCDFCFERKDY